MSLLPHHPHRPLVRDLRLVRDLPPKPNKRAILLPQQQQPIHKPIMKATAAKGIAICTAIDSELHEKREFSPDSSSDSLDAVGLLKENVEVGRSVGQGNSVVGANVSVVMGVGGGMSVGQR